MNLLNTMLDAAKNYLNKGLCVIPCGPDKRPLFTWCDFQKRKPTEEEITEWWTGRQDANVAIVTGKLSGLTVIDCDTAEAIEKFENLLPDSFECPIVQTPRGGRHYYFKYCPELHSRNAAQDGIDVKSEGGYVLAPPSRTEKGGYSWHPILSFGNIEPPLITKEILHFLNPATQDYTPPSSGVLDLGHRDNYLFHTALRLFYDGLNDKEVEQIVCNMAKVANPPFPEKEALEKVKSAYKRFREKHQKTASSIFFPVKKRFTECDPEPVPWLMKNRIPLGMLTIFLGNPGEGKTFVAIEFAARLSKGDPLPGCTEALVKSSTIFISAENALNYILVPRAIACGADRSRLIHIPTVQNENDEIFIFDVTRHLMVLQEEINHDPDIKLVIVDPLISHLASDIDSFKPVQIRHALDQLAVFAEKTGVAIVVILHLNKSVTSDIIFRASGSVQFMAAAKAAFLITKDTHDSAGHRRLFIPIKSNLSADYSSLVFKIEPHTVRYKDKVIDVGRVVFEQIPVEVDVMDIMSPDNRFEKNLVGQAIDLLNESLRDGPKTVQELEQKALEIGINRSTLKKARRRRGIVAEKTSMLGGWLCYLPEHYSGLREG